MTHVVGYTNSARYRCLEDLQKASMDLCLSYCGWENCHPSHRFGPNERETHALHIVRSGKGVLEINKKKYRLEKGDAFYIPPMAKAWYEADREDPWSYVWVGFSGLRADEYVVNAGFTLKNPVRRVSCANYVGTCIERILEAHQLSRGNELRRNALLMLCFSELIDDYCQKSSEGGCESAHTYQGAVYANYAAEYMLYHYDEKVRIQDLANYIGVNRSYLASSFKKTIGCSLQEFLMNLRMEKAKSLLRTTDMSISAVARAVGYTDQLAFSKGFKQRCGVSPSMYKEEKGELIEFDRKQEYPLDLQQVSEFLKERGKESKTTTTYMEKENRHD